MKECITNEACKTCADIRAQRKRVLREGDPLPEDLSTPAFAAAPAIYSFNVPRYFTTQIRAREFGKSHHRQITWFYARDVPLHRDDRDLSAEALMNKLKSWLHRHDQETGHIASIFPLVTNLPVRLTDKVAANQEYKLYRGRRGRIYGWIPHPQSNI